MRNRLIRVFSKIPRDSKSAVWSKVKKYGKPSDRDSFEEFFSRDANRRSNNRSKEDVEEEFRRRNHNDHSFNEEKSDSFSSYNEELFNKSKSEFFSREELSKERLSRSSIENFIRVLGGKTKETEKALNLLNKLYLKQEASKPVYHMPIDRERRDKLDELKLLQAENLLVNLTEEVKSVEQRLLKELEKEKIYGISNFAKAILSIIDNLDRSLIETKAEEDNEPDIPVTKREQNILDNISEIRANAKEILKKYLITEIDTKIGTIANPNQEEIVFFIPIPGRHDNEIIDIMQKGYFIGERVLRPSKVGVIKNN